MHQFDELQLPVALQKALKKMKFDKPTPIQAQAIPIALEQKDLIGLAQTGTGKTAAFCIPLIARLLEVPEKKALILVPTRELAVQIADVLDELTAFCPEISSALFIGGMSMQVQQWAIHRNPRIYVATPGRLTDHLRRRSLTLAAIDVLVLDEADRMLHMGFAPQLNEILRYLPENRQTLFFSATMPPNIENLSKQFLKNPARVTVGLNAQPVQKIQQSVIQTTSFKKNDTLMEELSNRTGQILIFTRTKSRTDRLANYLEQFGHLVTRLHGGRTQIQRNSAMTGFRSGRFRILVATDIAARGIDISQIAHVINYDLPQAPEDYIHRIGRTARAGAEGQAVSILTPEDKIQWREISRLMAGNVAPLPLKTPA